MSSALPFLWGVPSALRTPARWPVPGTVPLPFRRGGSEEGVDGASAGARLVLADGREVRVRPVRAQDADGEQRFIESLSLDTRYHRFHAPIRRLSPDLLRRMVHADRRQFALVVESNDVPGDGGAAADDDGKALVADARWVLADDADDRAEFAIVVADGWQRTGLGLRLLLRLMAEARVRGVRTLHGDVLHDNLAMAALLHKAGGRFAASDDPRVRRAVITLE